MMHSSKETIWCSVTSSSFTFPEKFRDETLGPRRKHLENYLTCKILKEVAEKLGEKHDEMSSSEYKEKFCDAGFQPAVDQPFQHSELHKKHPLYKDLGLSYWLHNKRQIHGVTLQPHPSLPFNRSASFSKPISEVLDEPIRGQ